MTNRQPDIEELRADLATAEQELAALKKKGTDPQSRPYRNAEDVVRVLKRKVQSLDWKAKRREEEEKKVESMDPIALAEYVSPRSEV